MALLPDVFEPDEADSVSFDIIPAGWYPAEIIKSNLKNTKDGKGKYISIQFKINEGDHIGRFVFTNLNIINNNEMAVRIARSDLKAICSAVGHSGDLEDTEDLHNIPLDIKLTIKASTAQWPERNEIKGYRETKDEG